MSPNNDYVRPSRGAVDRTPDTNRPSRSYNGGGRERAPRIDTGGGSRGNWGGGNSGGGNSGGGNSGGGGGGSRTDGGGRHR
jgi:hypothetical protein